VNTIRYQPVPDIPVTREADAIVVGGGPGGLGAAVMAARCGAKTLLVERFGFLGGMASAGEVHPFMSNHVDGEPLDRPVYTDWVERMRAYWPREDKERHISKDVAMLAAEDLCADAGVELLYHHHLADAVVSRGAIEALVLFSKSGFTAAKASVYIDCTGDGDLAARAGCECEQGGPSGYCQPMTLCFKLSRVDLSRVPPREEVNRLYDEAKSRGEIACPRENVLAFGWLEDDVMHFNTTRVIRRNGVSGEELSAAEIEGRRQLRQFVRFLRARVPGYENAQIHSIAHHIGVRETRRVRGVQYLTREAFDRRAKFPDAIARVRYDRPRPRGRLVRGPVRVRRREGRDEPADRRPADLRGPRHSQQHARHAAGLLGRTGRGRRGRHGRSARMRSARAGWRGGAEDARRARSASLTGRESRFGEGRTSRANYRQENTS